MSHCHRPTIHFPVAYQERLEGVAKRLGGVANAVEVGEGVRGWAHAFTPEGLLSRTLYSPARTMLLLSVCGRTMWTVSSRKPGLCLRSLSLCFFVKDSP